jgi:hypothetical protein
MVRPLAPGGTATQEFPPRRAEWQRLRTVIFSVSHRASDTVDIVNGGDFFCTSSLSVAGAGPYRGGTKICQGIDVKTQELRALTERFGATKRAPRIAKALKKYGLGTRRLELPDLYRVKRQPAIESKGVNNRRNRQNRNTRRNLLPNCWQVGSGPNRGDQPGARGMAKSDVCRWALGQSEERRRPESR